MLRNNEAIARNDLTGKRRLLTWLPLNRWLLDNRFIFSKSGSALILQIVLYFPLITWNDVS